MPKTIARTPEAIRTALLADPNVAELAKTIGVSIDDYIEQVIHFAMNPGADPQLGVLTAEGFAEAGLPPPPTDDQIGRYLIDALQVHNATNGSEFSEARQEVVDLGKNPKDSEPIEKTDEKLKEALQKELLSKRANR
jgi:hypothetical protein